MLLHKLCGHHPSMGLSPAIEWRRQKCRLHSLAEACWHLRKHAGSHEKFVVTAVCTAESWQPSPKQATPLALRAVSRSQTWTMGNCLIWSALHLAPLCRGQGRTKV